MTTPLPTESVRSRLVRKSQIAPTTPMSQNHLGVKIFSREDAVLLHLAQSDEREYQKMYDTSNAISGGIEQRRNGLIALGSEVVVGPSGSPQAERLRDFVVAALKRIPSWHTLLREMLMTQYLGWRPVRLDWDGEFVFEGRPYLGIARAIAEDPWRYQFTREMQLVFVGNDGVRAHVFDKPEDEYRWVICRSGSTRQPYGESQLRRTWLLYFVSKQFERMSAQAMQRALGLMKIAYDGVGDLSGAPDEEQLDDELRLILNKVNSMNVLVELSGWSIEMINTAQFSSSHKEMMRYFDDKLTSAIVGQNLTTHVTEGALASTKVHKEILESYMRADARELQDWINDQIVDRLVLLNFGEQAAEDLPRWRSAIFSTPDMDAVKLFMEYGGEVDGRRIADVFNVPTAPAEVDDDSIILAKPRAQQVVVRGDIDPDDGDGGRSSAAGADQVELSAPPSWDEQEISRDFRAASDSLDDAVSEAVAGSIDQADAYFSDLGSRLLERNDPKATEPSA